MLLVLIVAVWFVLESETFSRLCNNDVPTCQFHRPLVGPGVTDVIAQR